MKIISLLIIGLTIASSQITYGQTGSVYGIVKDQLDQQPIEFATVALYNSSDSSLLSGIITSVEGIFLIEEVPFGSYYAKINFIGYTSVYVDSITISSDLLGIDLATVLLTSSNELGTVEVNSNLSLFQSRIDKKVFNAEKTMIGKGRSGLDMLRQVPLITVDSKDVIFLRGSSSVNVLIDGRPTALPANQLLKQMPASAISKVEIITNPSAKYDPEGMAGIINVILNKEQAKGVNGSVFLSVGYGNFPKYNPTFSLNYRNGKFNVYGRYSAFYQRHWSKDIQNTDALLPDSTVQGLRALEEYENIGYGHNATIGLDYFVNDKNTLYFATSGNKYESMYLGGVGFRDVNGNEELLSTSYRSMDIDAPGMGYSFNGGWQRSFKKEGATLDLDFNYNQNDNPETEVYVHNFYDLEANLLGTNFQNTDTYYLKKTTLAKVDYYLPFGENFELETGFHFTRRLTNNNLLSQSAASDAVFTPDLDLSNEFNFKQDVFAGYLAIGKSFKKLGIKAGLRPEHTLTEGTLKNTGEVNNVDYFKLFPSLALSYETEKNSEFSIGYSKRINRPTYEQLNPFYGFWDIYTIERGNPQLRPEIIHVTEFNYIKFWKKFNFNSSIYYRYITDLIRRNLTNDGINSVLQYDNLGSSSLTGGDLSFTYLPIKGLRIMSQSSIWNIRTNEEQVVLESQNYIGWITSLYAVMETKKGWIFEIFTDFAPKARSIQGTIFANYGIGGAISKEILNKRGNIGFYVDDIFKTRQYTFLNDDLQGYNFYLKSTMESRAIYFNFSYNFGKVIEGKNRRKGGVGDASDDMEIKGIED